MSIFTPFSFVFKFFERYFFLCLNIYQIDANRIIDCVKMGRYAIYDSLTARSSSPTINNGRYEMQVTNDRIINAIAHCKVHFLYQYRWFLGGIFDSCNNSLKLQKIKITQQTLYFQ